MCRSTREGAFTGSGGLHAQSSGTSLLKWLLWLTQQQAIQQFLTPHYPGCLCFWASLTTTDGLIGGKVVSVKTDFPDQTTDISLQVQVCHYCLRTEGVGKLFSQESRIFKDVFPCEPYKILFYSKYN